MVPILIVGGRRERLLADMLAGAFSACDRDDFSLEIAPRPEAFIAPYGLLIAARPLVHAAPPSLSPGIVALMEGSNRRAAAMLSATGNAAVCCGMSGRDTVTLSSLRDDAALVCLQRTVTTLSGGAVEPCEIPVRLSRRRHKRDILFAAAALILGDCPTDEGFRI